MTILIAEDNAVLAKNIVKCLCRCGYEAVSVGTAAAARRILAGTPVSALCLDLQLPDGNGMSIIEDREGFFTPNLPVVVMTGTGTEEDRRRAEACGARAFLMKPFALDELKAVLAEALGTPKPRDRSARARGAALDGWNCMNSGRRS
jgi:DNA-binding response OmpR family regulator